MTHHTTAVSSCLSSISGVSPQRTLPPAPSPNVSASRPTAGLIITQIGAAALILASAGFGAYYAWSTGSHHGPLLASLMVMMAIGLELAKPISLAAAFESFRSWSIFRGLALLMLALIAVAYSLTAELTLMATTRGDASAERLARASAATKAEERYASAKAAHDALPLTRPAAAIQADIDAIDRLPGIMIEGVPCGGTLNGKVTREHCPRRAALAIELATANERQRLLGEMRAAEEAQAKTGTGAVTAADPGAAALSTYLAAFGLVVPAALLTEWMALVGVLALELGSALSLVLVQAERSYAQERSNRKRAAVPEAVHTPPVPVVQPREAEAPSDTPSAREDVKTRIVAQLKASGGSKVASERGLAKLLGTSKPTARRALQSLVLAGVIAAEATRNGTVLRLVA